jgi:hypothetical protein
MSVFLAILALYIIVGIGVLVYIVIKDPYGGFVLHVAPLVIFCYPYLFIRSLFDK